MKTLGGTSRGLGNGGLSRSPFSRRLRSRLSESEQASAELTALADLQPFDRVRINGETAVLGTRFREGGKWRVRFTLPGRPGDYSLPEESGVEFLSRPRPVFEGR